MKKAKKVLLLVLCAALLVGATVAGTVAYLTSTDKVENTFTVGKVAITLDEADVKTDGTLETTYDNRVDENEYHLLPGHTYIKDPIIHVDDASEDCYLFVTIKNEITGIEATGATTVAEQMKAKGWVPVDGVSNTYVYIGTGEGAPTPLAVAKGDDIPVFDKIVIDASIDNDTLAGYADKTITVNAYAVQKDGFEGKTAVEIWNATFGASSNS